MRSRAKRTIAAAVLAVATATGIAASPAYAATQTFYGYGFSPDAAHSAAVANMQAYSSSCVEISTTYSEAGSEHYWQATLTADC
jgi:hypothetical protein